MHHCYPAVSCQNLLHPFLSLTPSLSFAGSMRGGLVNEKPLYVVATRFPSPATPWPRYLCTYLNIVIEAGLRWLQVKIFEGQFHHIAFWDVDIPGADVIVGIRLGVTGGSDLPKKLSWDRTGTDHSNKEEGPREKRNVPVNTASKLWHCTKLGHPKSGETSQVTCALSNGIQTRAV